MHHPGLGRFLSRRVSIAVLLVLYASQIVPHHHPDGSHADHDLIPAHDAFSSRPHNDHGALPSHAHHTTDHHDHECASEPWDPVHHHDLAQHLDHHFVRVHNENFDGFGNFAVSAITLDVHPPDHGCSKTPDSDDEPVVVYTPNKLDPRGPPPSPDLVL